MAANKEIWKYLSFNGRRELPPLPDKLTELGKESLIVLADIFQQLYRTQHSLMLDSRNDPFQYDHFLENEERYLSAELEIRSASLRAKSGVLLPVFYEVDHEMDFAPLLADTCGESSNDIHIGIDGKGKFCAKVNPSDTRHRSYLAGITRQGIMTLIKNGTIRRLWIDLLIKNSYNLRSFKNEFSNEEIRMGFERSFDALTR